MKDSKKIRAGKGKMRNRRYVMRRGPLVVYDKSEVTVNFCCPKIICTLV